MPEGSGLKRKVGPLPVWGWLGAVALGVVFLYWRSRHPATAAAPADQASSQDVAGTAGAPGAPGPTPDVSTELSDLLSLYKFGAYITQQAQPPAPKVVHNCPRGFHWNHKHKRCAQSQKVCPPGWHWSQVQGRCVRKPHKGSGGHHKRQHKRGRGGNAQNQGAGTY